MRFPVSIWSLLVLCKLRQSGLAGSTTSKVCADSRTNSYPVGGKASTWSHSAESRFLPEWLMQLCAPWCRVAYRNSLHGKRCASFAENSDAPRAAYRRATFRRRELGLPHRACELLHADNHNSHPFIAILLETARRTFFYNTHQARQ